MLFLSRIQVILSGAMIAWFSFWPSRPTTKLPALSLGDNQNNQVVRLVEFTTTIVLVRPTLWVPGK